MKKKLRVGILVDQRSIKNWEYSILETIHESDYAEISLVISNQKSYSPGDSVLTRNWKEKNYKLYYTYRKLENKLHKVSNDATASTTIDKLNLQCPVLEVHPIQTKFKDVLETTDIEKAEEHQIDVFIRFGFRILSGEILKTAKYGVWSYHHGDNKFNRGMPAGVWEFLNDEPETGVTLQILSESLDDGYILDRAYQFTDTTSIRKNNNRLYWKGTTLLPRKLKQLYTLGEEKFFDLLRTKNEHLDVYYSPLYKTPTNSVLAGRLFRKYFQRFNNKLKNIGTVNQWRLLYKPNVGDKPASSFFNFKNIVPPSDRFWADPFVYSKDGLNYIFFEECLYAENKGKISYITVDNKGNHTPSKVVVEENYHLSYPFLLEENGQLYMIPESLAHKKIDLYRCESFPDKWVFVKTLMDNVEAVDTTLFKKDGKFWLFTNMKESKHSNTLDELFLFYTDDLLTGNWQGHPLNPIVSDIKCARPAGSLFSYNNKLYRPSQNSSKHYGYGLQIMEILTLNESAYEERQVQSIYPNWNKDLISTHTFNFNDRITVIDALVRRRK